MVLVITTVFASRSLLLLYAFSFSGPAAWNKLPHDSRDSLSLDVFKRKLTI